MPSSRPNCGVNFFYLTFFCRTVFDDLKATLQKKRNPTHAGTHEAEEFWNGIGGAPGAASATKAGIMLAAFKEEDKELLEIMA
ncbi:hypothetical protein IMZ48_43755 [Candidatus Bathyarchaeota archaeon]|nr:hypothetical protein [Candidatus Bathyarchaeota archaeon]